MLIEAEVIDKFSQINPQLPEAFDDCYPPHPTLLLASDGPVEVFYAPLDYVNATAKIAIGVSRLQSTRCGAALSHQICDAAEALLGDAAAKFCFRDTGRL